MFEVMKFEWAGRSGLIAVRSSQSFVCCLISALTKAGTTKTCQPIKIIMFALVANQKVVIDWPCFGVVLGGSFLPRGGYTVLLFKVSSFECVKFCFSIKMNKRARSPVVFFLTGSMITGRAKGSSR